MPVSMLTYIFVAGSLFISLLILSRRTWSSFLRWPLALFVATIALLFFTLLSPVFLGSGPWFDASPWREVLLFVLMLLGMVFRSLSAAIDKRRPRRPLR